MGTATCVNITYNSESSATCVTGASVTPGDADIEFETFSGGGSAATVPFYFASPSLDAVAPTNGSVAGNPITITGVDLGFVRLLPILLRLLGVGACFSAAQRQGSWPDAHDHTLSNLFVPFNHGRRSTRTWCQCRSVALS